MTTADAFSPLPSDGAVHFLGNEGAYWRLRIKGAALVMVTLGIYRFWLATDVRRFLWSNTEIDGETLEYNGLATELLVGFLFALAILVPLYTAIATAALELERAVGDLRCHRLPALRAARRIRALPGAALPADAHGVPRLAFQSTRIGLALCPLRAVLVEHRHSYPRARLSLGAGGPAAFQDAQHQLRRSARPVRRIGSGVVSARAAVMASGRRAARHRTRGGGCNAGLGCVERRCRAEGDDDAMAKFAASVVSGRAFAIGLAAIGTSVVATVLLYPLFQAMVLRWWISGLRFGAVAVVSRLRTAPVYRVYLRFIFFIFLLAARCHRRRRRGPVCHRRAARPGPRFQSGRARGDCDLCRPLCHCRARCLDHLSSRGDARDVAARRAIGRAFRRASARIRCAPRVCRLRRWARVWPMPSGSEGFRPAMSFRRPMP